MNKDIKLYNILLPIWLIVFIPSWLWLLLIPANYLIDRIVLRWSLGDMPEKGLFCRKHNWKICLAGFLGDFIGALLLYFVSISLEIEDLGTAVADFLYEVSNGIMLNPFSNVLSLIVVIVSMALAALCIYFMDRGILTRAGLNLEQARKSAIRLAIITAPYVYLIPSEWFYSGMY